MSILHLEVARSWGPKACLNLITPLSWCYLLSSMILVWLSLWTSCWQQGLPCVTNLEKTWRPPSCPCAWSMLLLQHRSQGKQPREAPEGQNAIKTNKTFCYLMGAKERGFASWVMPLPPTLTTSDSLLSLPSFPTALLVVLLIHDISPSDVQVQQLGAQLGKCVSLEGRGFTPPVALAMNYQGC